MNRGTLYFPKGPDQLLPVAIIGESRGLVIQNDGTTPNSVIQLSAEEVVLKSGVGRQLLASNVAASADITLYGPGGLDAGAEAVSTWFYVWLASNGTDLAALLSLSAAEINLMFGWEYRALLGAVYNDAGSNLVKFWQAGHRVHTAPVTITPAAAVAAFSIATAVPPIARTAFGSAGSGAGDFLMSIAGDANGVGQIDLRLASALPIRRGYFELPLMTAQTLYNIAGTQPQLQISGFTI